MKSIILVISILVNVFFATKIINLENFRYSVIVGMCGENKDVLERTKWIECNKNTKTRTNDLAVLYYGLTY